MKYKVIETFADLQDAKHVYGIGDVYPREGYTPSAERIDELATSKNLLHKPLIQKVEEPEPVVEEPVVEEQKVEEPEEKQEEEKPKRKRAK